MARESVTSPTTPHLSTGPRKRLTDGSGPMGVLRERGFRQYSVGTGVSGLATSLLQAVILWQVYATSGSALSLGLVGLVAFFATSVSSLLGGAVVDSYDRRTILFASQIGPGLASLLMLAAIATQHVSLGLIYALVLLGGIAASLENPARQSILPDVIPRHLFTRALTANAAVGSATSVMGPALAGILIAIGGIGAAYAAHLVLIAIALGALIPLRVSVEPSGGRISLRLVREGVDFVRTRPVLLGAMTLDMFAVLFGGARALLPIYAVSVLHASAVGYGILSASTEAGTLLMAAVLLVLPTPHQTGRVLLSAVALFGVATVVFGLSTALPLSVAAYALVGMADQVSMVMRRTTIQLSTPDALRGRVTGVSSIFISASNELGALESGLVAAATGAVFAVVSGGIACVLVVGLIAWLVPDLRRHQIQSSEAGQRSAPC
jgi:MFS family permease